MLMGEVDVPAELLARSVSGMSAQVPDALWNCTCTVKVLEPTKVLFHDTWFHAGALPSLKLIAVEMTVPWVAGFFGAMKNGCVQGEAVIEAFDSIVWVVDHFVPSQ